MSTRIMTARPSQPAPPEQSRSRRNNDGEDAERARPANATVVSTAPAATLAFYASSVLLGMLRAASVDLARLNNAMSARIRLRKSAMNDRNRLPRLIAPAVPFRVARIRRRSRYILLEADGIGCRYSERGRPDCTFILPGVLPHNIQIAASGRRLREVVHLGPAASVFGDLLILEPVDVWSRATGVSVDPGRVRHDAGAGG